MFARRPYNPRLARRGRPSLWFSFPPYEAGSAMKIHEFQAKEILRKAGVAVPQGIVGARGRGGRRVSQARWPDRGRQGTDSCRRPRQGDDQGQSASSTACNWCAAAEEAAKVAGGLLGKPLVTIQTGPEGQTVRQVLVEEGCDIARELYLGIVVDRASAGPVLMVSSEGGMDIEHVAAETPELIYRERFDPTPVCRAFRSASWRRSLGLRGRACASAEKFMKAVVPGLCPVAIAAWPRSIRWS